MHRKRAPKEDPQLVVMLVSCGQVSLSRFLGPDGKGRNMTGALGAKAAESATFITVRLNPFVNFFFSVCTLNRDKQKAGRSLQLAGATERCAQAMSGAPPYSCPHRRRRNTRATISRPRCCSHQLCSHAYKSRAPSHCRRKAYRRQLPPCQLSSSNS